MPEVKFMVTTVATPHQGQAANLAPVLSDLSKEVRKNSSAVMVRLGRLASGSRAGQFLFMQAYKSMADIEATYDYLAASTTYAEALKLGTPTARGIGRTLMWEPNTTSINPKYMVLTRFSADTPLVDEAKHILGIMKENGALGGGFSISMTGPIVGKYRLGVGYPSMAAIEASYDAAQEDSVFQSTLAKVNLDFRNIVRILD